MSKYQILHEKRSYFIKKHRTSRERKPDRRKKIYQFSPGRTEQLQLNMIEGIALAIDWETNFRMSKSQLDYLAEIIARLISQNLISPRRAISRQKIQQLQLVNLFMGYVMPFQITLDLSTYFYQETRKSVRIRG